MKNSTKWLIVCYINLCFTVLTQLALNGLLAVLCFVMYLALKREGV